MNEFLYFDTSFPKRHFITSTPIAPTTMAVVVARAGMILPAIILT
jgi:hypothetical protein